MSKALQVLRSVQHIDLSPVLATLSNVATHAIVAWGSTAPVVIGYINIPEF